MRGWYRHAKGVGLVFAWVCVMALLSLAFSWQVCFVSEGMLYTTYATNCAHVSGLALLFLAEGTARLSVVLVELSDPRKTTLRM